jgi:ABC-type Fe3+/spermidine/putrescine transport system ATPase subunit
VDLLSVGGLTVSYDAIRAVRDFSFHVGVGEIVAILGANGAGKSSTLSAVMGLASRVDGSVRYDGQEIRGMRPERIVRLGMTLTPEGRRVFPRLTVGRTRFSAIPLADRRCAEDRQAYDRFPVSACRWRPDLSGGEQQLAIAAAHVRRGTLPTSRRSASRRVRRPHLRLHLDLRREGVMISPSRMSTRPPIVIAGLAPASSGCRPAAELRASTGSSAVPGSGLIDGHCHPAAHQRHQPGGAHALPRSGWRRLQHHGPRQPPGRSRPWAVRHVVRDDPAGAPLPLVFLAAVGAAMAAALLMERIAFRPVRGASGSTMLLTSFAVSVILQVTFQNVISPRPRGIQLPPEMSQVIQVFGVGVGLIQLTAIVMVLLSLGLLTLPAPDDAGRACARPRRTSTRLWGSGPTGGRHRVRHLGPLAGVAAFLWSPSAAPWTRRWA